MSSPASWTANRIADGCRRASWSMWRGSACLARRLLDSAVAMVAAMPIARISALIAALLLIPVAVADAKPAKVKVMTRNLYLGADLSPGMNAKDLQGLVNGAGTIL